MRKLSKLVKMIVVPALMIVGVVSCNKNDLEVTPQETLQNSATVSSSKLGFLEFKDVETFQQTVSKLKDLSQDERIAWEKKHNFTSLKSIHEKVLSDESELYGKLKITFKDVTKINDSDFPAIHSESFEKYKNSIVSTGERIINTPSMDIGFSEYATIVDKDGYVKIGKGLFQFEKGLIKVSNIVGEVKSTDLDIINQARKSTSNVKIIASNTNSSNTKISSFNGSLFSPPAALGSRLIFGRVDYQDTFKVADPSEPGAFFVNFLGLSFWFAPIVSTKTSMVVHRSYWYAGPAPESNCPVSLEGNIITTGYQYGQTNSAGIFEHDSFVYGSGSFALPIVNVGFRLPNSTGGYSQVTSIFQYL